MDLQLESLKKEVNLVTKYLLHVNAFVDMGINSRTKSFFLFPNISESFIRFLCFI